MHTNEGDDAVRSAAVVPRLAAVGAVVLGGQPADRQQGPPADRLAQAPVEHLLADVQPTALHENPCLAEDPLDKRFRVGLDVALQQCTAALRGANYLLRVGNLH